MQLNAARRKVLARGSTPVVHSAAGQITTNVDVSSYNLPLSTRCVEKFLGFTVGASIPATSFYARIRLTSPSCLEVVTRSQSGSAITITAYWEILKALGRVQRGTVNAAVATNTVTTNVTLDPVNTNTAEAFQNGYEVNAATYFCNCAFKITAATNLEVHSSMYGNNTLTSNWVVDGG